MVALAALGSMWPRGARADREHTAYLDLFGKTGLYGAGYDREVAPNVGVGIVASVQWLESERIASLAPYLMFLPLSMGRHRWFLHLGPSAVVRTIDSPVEAWSGHRSTTLAAQASTGYEYRHRIVVRSYVMASAGRGGIAPWAGVSIGVDL